MQLYERIEALCSQSGISITQMCRDCGISRAAISDLKMGRSKRITVKSAQKIADYFGVSLESIFERDGSSPSVTIPVYGHIAAGLPILTENIIIGYEMIPAEMNRGRDHYCLEIVGDSLEPEAHSGDRVIIRKTDEFVSGAVCVVLINGEEGTLKKVIVRHDGITLIPINTSYPPIHFSKKEVEELPVRCCGVVVERRGPMRV